MRSGPADAQAPFLVKPTLTGQRVRLRAMTRADAEPLLAAMADREVLWFTGMLRGAEDPGPKLELAPARDWYGHLAQDPTRLDLAVVDLATDQVLGEVVLNEWDAGSESVNLRTFLGPAGRGRGVGRETLSLVLQHAFATVGLHRVELEVFAFNHRAIALYTSLGFAFEGTRRQVLRVDEQWHDAHTMALLAHEWSDHPGTPESKRIRCPGGKTHAAGETWRLRQSSC